MKHSNLSKTNRYLQDRTTRSILLGRTTASSAEVEGIRANRNAHTHSAERSKK